MKRNRFKAVLCLAALLGVQLPAQATLEGVAQAVAEGRYGEALERLDTLPGQLGSGVRGQFLEAAALAGRGELEAAEERYLALIEQAPARPEAYNNLAALYARQGRLDEARQLLEQAMATHPSYATVYQNLSSIYMAMSRSAYARALQMGERSSEQPQLERLLALAPTASAPPAAAKEDESAEVVATAVATPAEPDEQKAVESEASTAESPAEAAPLVAEVAAAESESAAEQSRPPESPAQTATAPSGGSEAVAAVRRHMHDWATAWAEQDVEGYLAAYSERFEPGRGLSQEQWRAQRRNRIRRPAFIQLELSELEVVMEEAGRARVELVQQYRSDTYRDRTRKRFGLIRQDGDWQILSEKTLEVL
ncbi:MAG: L,D-transpeptidase Cds6 family protein [Pseudomonadota bacterium]